jgi:glycosyltransferase involved in cell wall biosynthesis
MPSKLDAEPTDQYQMSIRGGTMNIVIYGQFSNYWSNSNVSRGLAQGLSEHGFDVFVHDPSSHYVGLPKDVTPTTTPELVGDVAIFVGYSALTDHRIFSHRVKIGAYIAESSILPSVWGFHAKRCDLVITPSRWTKNAYNQAGVDLDKILVVHHGLHHAFNRHLSLKTVKSNISFLHIAGARDFLGRKGTPELIRAFDDIFSPMREFKSIHAKLTIRSPDSMHIRSLLDNVKYPHLFEFDVQYEAIHPVHMVELLDKFDVVIQPSRAEAFGMVPLEARAMGLPVILTRGHGHLEHICDADTLIDVGGETPITVNGIPNGSAPSVSVDSIKKAISSFIKNLSEKYSESMQNAKGYYKKWSWKTVTENLKERIESWK